MDMDISKLICTNFFIFFILNTQIQKTSITSLVAQAFDLQSFSSSPSKQSLWPLHLSWFDMQEGFDEIFVPR